MGEFVAKKNEFLVFEEGPSQDVLLQWATYRDASDQCSLSRIWGGIHPPCDDIPGRIMGARIGIDAFAKAETYFSKGNPKLYILKELVKEYKPEQILADNEKAVAKTDEIFDELFKSITLKANQFKEGNCERNNPLTIFSKFSEKLIDMPGVSKIVELTKFELKKIKII